MNIFGQDYAGIYDALYDQYDFKAYTNAVSDFVGAFLGAGQYSILDLGCGTGAMTQLLKDRFTVTGVDLSPNMLSIAQEKNPGIVFHQGDVRTIDLRQEFDVVMMAGAVLGYQHENEHVLATLANVRRHLRPGGLFICDVWHGPAVLLNRPQPRLRSFTINGIEYIREVQSNLETMRHRCFCHYKWWTSHEGKLVSHTETHVMRYFFPMEMRLFLKCADFKLLRTCQAGTVCRDMTDQDWHITFVAQKPAGETESC